MKITKKMIAIFAVVLAVAAVLLVYNFVFTKKQEATEKVERLRLHPREARNDAAVQRRPLRVDGGKSGNACRRGAEKPPQAVSRRK